MEMLSKMENPNISTVLFLENWKNQFSFLFLFLFLFLIFPTLLWLIMSMFIYTLFDFRHLSCIEQINTKIGGVI